MDRVLCGILAYISIQALALRTDQGTDQDDGEMGLPQAMHSDRDQCLQPSGHPHSERLHEMEGCPVHSHGTDFESHLKERCFRGGYDHAHFAIVLR